MSIQNNNAARRVKPYRFAPGIRQELLELRQLDNWHTALALATDYGLIAAAISACHLVSWWCYPLALLIIGSRQRGLANLLHASTHGTLAANRSWNFISGTIFSGYLIFQRFLVYKHTHVTQHHGHFGDAHLDPDYRYHIEIGLYQARDRRSFLYRYILLPLIGAHIPAYLRYVVRERLLPCGVDLSKVSAPVSAATDLCLFCMQWLAIVALCAYFNVLEQLLLFWIVPFLTSAMFLGWLIELSEHYPLMANQADSTLELSRNRHLGKLEMLFMGVHQDNFHQEHHLDPQVPFWNLARSNRTRRLDAGFLKWDSQWGGIILRGNAGQPSLLGFINNRFLSRAPSAQSEEGEQNHVSH